MCMQEELDKQNPVIDDIDTQLNKVTSQLKTNNAKLKGLVTQVRPYWGRPAPCTATLTYRIPQQWLAPRWPCDHRATTSFVAECMH